MTYGDYLTWSVFKLKFMLAYLPFLAKLDTLWPFVGINDMIMKKNGFRRNHKKINVRIKAFALKLCLLNYLKEIWYN